MHGHLSNIMPPLLQLASTAGASGEGRPEAARQAITRIVATVTEVPLRTPRHAPPHWRRLNPRIRRSSRLLCIGSVEWSSSRALVVPPA